MKRALLVAPMFILAVGCGSSHSNAPSAEALLVSYDQAPSAAPYVTALDSLAPRCTNSRTDLAYAAEAGREKLVDKGYDSTDLDVLHALDAYVPAGLHNCVNELAGLEVSVSSSRNPELGENVGLG